MSGGEGVKALSSAERGALQRRAYLEELLAGTCKHLHTPEACEWCILEQLNAMPPTDEAGNPVRV